MEGIPTAVIFHLPLVLSSNLPSPLFLHLMHYFFLTKHFFPSPASTHLPILAHSVSKIKQFWAAELGKQVRPACWPGQGPGAQLIQACVFTENWLPPVYERRGKKYHTAAIPTLPQIPQSHVNASKTHHHQVENCCFVFVVFIFFNLFALLLPW